MVLRQGCEELATEDRSSPVLTLPVDGEGTIVPPSTGGLRLRRMPPVSRCHCPPVHGGDYGGKTGQRLCSHTNAVRSQSVVKSFYDTHRLEKFPETEQFSLSSQGCLICATFCVRKGTKVHVAGDHSESVGRPNWNPLPGPPRGRGGNECPPVYGGTTGGDSSLVAIESVEPGQFVCAHDGRSREILQVNRRRYRGPMVGLGHSCSGETLWLMPDHRVLAKMRPRTLGGKRDWSGAPLNHIERRKKLRGNMTPAEYTLVVAIATQPDRREIPASTPHWTLHSGFLQPASAPRC